MFTFEPGVAIWTLISFAIVLVFIFKIAYPPVRKVLDERRETIELSLKESQKNREAAQKLFQQSEEQLKGVREEAHRIVSEAETKGQALREQHTQKALQEYRELRNSKMHELQEMEAAFMKKIEGHVAELVVRSCDKVLRVDITPEQRDKIIYQRIQELENMKEL